MKKTSLKLIGLSLCFILLFSLVAVPLQAKTCFGGLMTCLVYSGMSGSAYAAAFCGIGYAVCAMYY